MELQREHWGGLGGGMKTDQGAGMPAVVGFEPFIWMSRDAHIRSRYQVTRLVHCSTNADVLRNDFLLTVK